LTEDYARNTRYLTNLADAISSLVLLSNKISLLKGHAKRVGEIVDRLDEADDKHVLQFTRITEETEFDHSSKGQIGEIVNMWKLKTEKRQKQEPSGISSMVGDVEVIEGENISFEHIDVLSPDGKLLAKDLTFTVKPGSNVMITGPNGAGKSSLFRLIGELWPPHRHENMKSSIVKPKKRDILFVPQKPYLVLGTLRDQVIYPHSYEDMREQNITDDDLEKLLSIVDPKGYIRKSWSWDEQKDWFHAFSGGQKQRIAMARLFYHKPKFAILDECTSAVSDEVEDEIYQTCNKLGITLFTVSHRKYLRKHHNYLLTIEGRDGKWSWKDITD
jgi:ATP-binding cassette subfamily D (ALD) protein 3